jgi:hypothetical protein
MSMDTGALASSASLFELDDYGAGVACDGARAPDGAVALDRRTFHAGDSISLQLSPGPHTVVLLAYDDNMTLLGSGCASQDLPPGGQICIDLVLDAAPDLAEPGAPADLAPVCCAAIHGSCAGCVLTCTTGYANCDGKASNGCEVDLHSPSSCGTTCMNRVDCTTKLLDATGVSCPAGACIFGGCANGFGNCDGIAANGCETSLDQPAACGTTCGNRVDCTMTVKNASGPNCTAGVCGYSGGCNGGWGDCDGATANGCETSLDLVGSCGTTCANKVDCNATVQNATVTGCAAGACTFTCTGAFVDCDLVASNGCETDLSALTSCGTTCANRVDCSTAVKNANGISCTGGACSYTTCHPGYVNCSGSPATGCETAQHIDGLGDYFTDCSVANGAWSLNLAKEAANAWDSSVASANGSSNLSGGTQYWVCVNSSAKSRSACWTYNATGSQTAAIGQVFLSAFNGLWLPGSGSNHGTQYSWY